LKKMGRRKKFSSKTRYGRIRYTFRKGVDEGGKGHEQRSARQKKKKDHSGLRESTEKKT